MQPREAGSNVVIEAINEGLRARRERRTHIAEDRSQLIQILRAGNVKAEAMADPSLRSARQCRWTTEGQGRDSMSRANSRCCSSFSWATARRVRAIRRSRAVRATLHGQCRAVGVEHSPVVEPPSGTDWSVDIFCLRMAPVRSGMGRTPGQTW